MNTIMCMLSMTLLLVLVPARGQIAICSQVDNDQCQEYYGSTCGGLTGKGSGVTSMSCAAQRFPYYSSGSTFLTTCNADAVASDASYAYRGKPCPGWNEKRAGQFVMHSAQTDVSDVALVHGVEVAASSLSMLKMIRYDTGATRKYLSPSLKIESAGGNLAILKADNTIETATTDYTCQFGDAQLAALHCTDRISNPSYTVTAAADIAVPGTITDMSMSKVNGFLAVAAGTSVHFKKITGEHATFEEITEMAGKDVADRNSVEFPSFQVSTVVWSPSDRYPIIAVGGLEGSVCKLKTYSFITGETSSVVVPSSTCNLHLSWSPDSLKIAVSYNGEVDTYEVQALGIIYGISDKLFTSQNGDITSLAWCPQNQKVVAGTSQGKVLVHDFQQTHTYESGSNTPITGMDISNDGEYIVLANGAGVHTMKGGAVFTSDSGIDDVVTSASTTSTAAITFATIALAPVVALVM